MIISNAQIQQTDPSLSELTQTPIPVCRVVDQAGNPCGNKVVQAKLPRADHRDDETNSPLMSLFDGTSFQQSFQPNSTILLHGYPADAIYLIVSGTVRCCTISAEGIRQIFHFASKGEFVGISDINTWHFTAEAVDHVIIKSIPRARVEQALTVSIRLRQQLQAHTCSQLECRERQLLSLVSTKAPERLFQFLREFAKSRRETGYVALPMGRRDIADHLGMSLETVSRAFSKLKGKGHIDLATAGKYRICLAPETALQPKHALRHSLNDVQRLYASPVLLPSSENAQ